MTRDRVQPHNMWGCSNAQIFSDVSPQMHWEFAVEHDMRWLTRWGLTYYGCCEPLDRKIEILRRIPNLRKISITPWADTASAVAQVGTDYVLSRKPNPNVFARDAWNPELARQQLVDFLDASRGCHRELIMKDISTRPIRTATPVGVGLDGDGGRRGLRRLSRLPILRVGLVNRLTQPPDGCDDTAFTVDVRHGRTRAWIGSS